MWEAKEQEREMGEGFVKYITVLWGQIIRELGNTLFATIKGISHEHILYAECFVHF